jgi:tetratricopeptide (TPR) repeat protein
MYYYRIEEWLVDSCATMNLIAGTNNKESEFSMSKNEKALEQYSKGETFLEKEDYKEALSWFEKAVKTDPKFAFAWDNIGICNRRFGNLDEALNAYQRSLAMDPVGKTPLHNIPVVYEFKKEYDKAIEAYIRLSKIYPDDPEAYYGTGRMYEMKNDYEKALDICAKPTMHT